MIEPVGGYGGMEVYDVGVCDSLGSTDADVTLLTCNQTEYVSHKNNFKIKRVFGDMFVKNMWYMKLWFFLRGLILSLRSIHKEESDIVYLHMFTFSLVELALLSVTFFCKAKVVVNIHDPISFSESQNPVSKWLCKVAFSIRGCVLTTHSNFSKKIIENELPGFSVEIMPHSDFDFIYDFEACSKEAKQLLGIDVNEDYILFFGQIKKNKGIDLLIEAWANIAHRFPNKKLLIVGRPWRDDPIKYTELIKKYHLTDRIKWVNEYVHNKDVPKYFKASILVVLPYREIYSSGVLLRAIGYKVPVLVSDCEAFLELISHMENGLVFEKENVEDLASKLSYALENQETLARILQTALATVNVDRSWTNVGNEMHVFFKRLSKNGG